MGFHNAPLNNFGMERIHEKTLNPKLLFNQPTVVMYEASGKVV